MDTAQSFGSAAIVVAVVAAINAKWDVPGRGSLVVGAIAALVVTVIWELGTRDPLGMPTNWAAAPLQALLGWLTAMGTWTGGKVAVTGHAGGEPKP